MMEMRSLDNLDRIIQDIEPGYIPAEFVSAARLTDDNGDSYIVSIDELEAMMMEADSLLDLGFEKVELVLNKEEIKAAIKENSEYILSSIPL